MVTRKDKMLLSKMSLKLTMLSAVLAKHQEIWLLCKQIWYVPFIWSLTWFSFWTFRDIAIWHTSPLQVNPLNYVGLCTSTAVLLFRTQFRTQTQKLRVFAASKLRTTVQKKTLIIGTKLKSCIQKAPALAGSSVKKAYKTTHSFVDSTFSFTSQKERTAKHKEHIKKTLNKKQSDAKKAEQTAQQIRSPSSNVNARDENADFSSQHQETDEIPGECLMCEELVRCVYRQDKTYCSEVQARIANEQ